MLAIPYTKIIPYPFAVVLEQYFDFEHIAHVHPTTLGEYVLVENAGHRLVYDQYWPPDRMGRRATSRVVQTYEPPGDIAFEFIAGRHRGVRVQSQLRPHPNGTRVTEIYHLPWLPNWSILRRLLTPLVRRPVDRIWDEDLRVGVCIGGWPGVPDQPPRNESEEWRRPLSPSRYVVGPVQDFAPGSLVAVNTPGGRVLIAHTSRGLRALHAVCPHTGGPLELGQLEKDCVRCPWHGARFDLETGQALSGPTRLPLPCYETRMIDSQLMVEANGGRENAPPGRSEMNHHLQRNSVLPGGAQQHPLN